MKEIFKEILNGYKVLDVLEFLIIRPVYKRILRCYMHNRTPINYDHIKCQITP